MGLVSSHVSLRYDLNSFAFFPRIFLQVILICLSLEDCYHSVPYRLRASPFHPGGSLSL